MIEVIKFTGRNADPRAIKIGNETENLAQEVKFILPSKLDNAAVFLHLQIGDSADVVLLGEDRVYRPTRTHTQAPGRISAYLEAQSVGDVVWKSNTFFMHVGALPNGGEVIEQMYPTAIEEALKAVDTLTGVDARAETLDPSSEAAVRTEDVDGQRVLVFGIPQGDKGDKGDKGDVGPTGPQGGRGVAVVPRLTTIIDIDTGAPMGYELNWFTSTNPTPPSRVLIYHGKDGDDGYTPVKGKDYFDGQDGNPGADGFSPTVEVAPIEGGNRVTITDKVGKKTFDVMDGKDGEGGSGGDPVPGEDGEDGGYYIPEVSAEGDLSWTPTKADMAAVPTVNIKGAKGDKGDNGEAGSQGERGEKGETGAQGIQGPIGLTGPRGEQGPKGDKGDAGPQGPQGVAGADGTSVGIYSIAESTVSGGTTLVVFTDGKSLRVKNGKDGSDGQNGQPGAAGKDGADGNGIKSAILNADYTLTLTFDDGTSYTTPNIRGATGAAGSNGKDGSAGKNGTDGVGIASIKQTTTSTADDGNNVFTVTLTNGTSATFTVQNGSKGSSGSNGKDGADGYTPQRGTDYWTAADKQEIAQAAAGLVDVPEIVQTTGTATDKVMSQKAVTDEFGDVIRYAPQTLTNAQKAQAKANIGVKDTMLSLTEAQFDALTAEEITAHYNDGIRMVYVEDDHENLVPKAVGEGGAIYNGCGYLSNYRLNSSGGYEEADGAALTGYIPHTKGGTVCIEGGLGKVVDGAQYIAAYDSTFTQLAISQMETVLHYAGGTTEHTADNVIVYTIDTSAVSYAALKTAFANAAYIRVSLLPCIGKNIKVWYL